ncbi:MAG: hypothetical protein IPM53_22180 [Anaerolineaceae bacterium]|nr:hypothetical protein [Anaerolineaceae bacterium]
MNDKNQSPKKPADTEPKADRDGKLPPNNRTRPVEIISLDVDEEGEEPLELSAETTLDLLQEAREEEYEEEIARYTHDDDIVDTFEERQELNVGAAELYERLEEHHSKSPELSGGDIDAAWDDANVGEETVGGMAPTPDQDMVEEIGEAFGITYEDDEPLRTGDKLAERDDDRWELDPESVEDEDEAA